MQTYTKFLVLEFEDFMPTANSDAAGVLGITADGPTGMELTEAIEVDYQQRVEEAYDAGYDLLLEDYLEERYGDSVGFVQFVGVAKI